MSGSSSQRSQRDPNIKRTGKGTYIFPSQADRSEGSNTPFPLEYLCGGGGQAILASTFPSEMYWRNVPAHLSPVHFRLILMENEATGSRKVSKYLLGPVKCVLYAAPLFYPVCYMLHAPPLASAFPMPLPCSVQCITCCIHLPSQVCSPYQSLV